MTTSNRKKRKIVVNECIGDVSPPKEGGWTPWLSASQPTDHVDAPTLKLEKSNSSSRCQDENDSGFSSFAQLGSVLGKLESFNRDSKMTLSTAVSSIPSTAIVPVADLQDEDNSHSLQGMGEVVVKSVVFESTCRELWNRSNIFFDKFTYFSASKCGGSHLMSFATFFFEHPKTAWGVIEIPGSFGTTQYVVVERNHTAVSLHVSDFPLRNERTLSAELTAFGVSFETSYIQPTTKHRSEEESSSEEESGSSPILRINDGMNVFGFFDYLRKSEIKSPNISSSFPFKDSVCVEPRLSRVNKCAVDPTFRMVSIDNLCLPLAVLDQSTRGLTRGGCLKMRITSVGNKDPLATIVKRL